MAVYVGESLSIRVHDLEAAVQRFDGPWWRKSSFTHTERLAQREHRPKPTPRLIMKALQLPILSVTAPGRHWFPPPPPPAEYWEAFERVWGKHPDGDGYGISQSSDNTASGVV